MSQLQIEINDSSYIVIEKIRRSIQTIDFNVGAAYAQITKWQNVNNKQGETKMKLKFKKLDHNATIPSYSHAGDSGMDVTTVDDTAIPPHSFVTVRTGLAAEIPTGYEIQVRPRSGLQCRYGIVAAWGTVDEGYRGGICVALYNHNDEPYYVCAGDRVAQFVIAPVVRAEIEETDNLSEATERGTGGFGSTGR